MTADTGSALIIDDDQQVSASLSRVLRKTGLGAIVATSDPTRALELFERHAPDVVLLDLHMPKLNGFEVLEQLRRSSACDGKVPIVMLTGDDDSRQKLLALSKGATDFLIKPLDTTEVMLRVRALLETRGLERRLADQNRTLEVRITERTKALEVSQMEMLDRLATTAELRDDDTGQHTCRVGRTAGRLALALGMSEPAARIIDPAARLHDLGKIGIPDSILRKPGALTQEEYELMKSHTVIGGRILSGGQSPLIQTAERIALHHHERWDGMGYPTRLAGADIPIEARIVAVADFFDALTHDRPYRPAFSVDRTVDMIRLSSGLHFDPEVANAFLELVAGELQYLVGTPASRFDWWQDD
jgi:putative two-component system response regulator